MKLSHPSLSAVEAAILHTVAYADVFDYPLTAEEVHRYLVGMRASPTTIEPILDNGRLVPQRLVHQQGYFTLPGREAIIKTRRRRAQIAARMWPRAVRYGRMIARLPFVRMVAVTGALTMDNVEPNADLDYLIVTEPDRLWLCRAMVIVLVRLAARYGDVICPNYFLSERTLVVHEHSLFTAHELMQMVPIAGIATYRRMCQLNAWAARFLPNAYCLPRDEGSHSSSSPTEDPQDIPRTWRPIRALIEIALRTPLGARLERWEMSRKVRKFSQQRDMSPLDITAGAYTGNTPKVKNEGFPRPHGESEATFGADMCKGHFDNHGQRTLEAFASRLRALTIPMPPEIDLGAGVENEPPGGSV